MNDLTGLKFRMLTVLHKDGHKGKHLAWRCRCDCGNEVVLAGNHLLKLNGTASCGCIRKVHGESPAPGRNATPMHNTWTQMRSRCNNPRARDYKHYGGRGIKVCAAWDSYEQFKRDMGERPSPEHTLDRIDNNGNYEPSNCRWATRLEQKANTRVVRRIEYKGRIMVLSQWARELGMTPSHLHYHVEQRGEWEALDYLFKRS